MYEYGQIHKQRSFINRLAITDSLGRKTGDKIFFILLLQLLPLYLLLTAER